MPTSSPSPEETSWGAFKIGSVPACTWGLLPCILGLGAAVPRALDTQATVTARQFGQAAPPAPLLQARHHLTLDLRASSGQNPRAMPQ